MRSPLRHRLFDIARQIEVLGLIRRPLDLLDVCDDLAGDAARVSRLGRGVVHSVLNPENLVDDDVGRRRRAEDEHERRLAAPVDRAQTTDRLADLLFAPRGVDGSAETPRHRTHLPHSLMAVAQPQFSVPLQPVERLVVCGPASAAAVVGLVGDRIIGREGRRHAIDRVRRPLRTTQHHHAGVFLRPVEAS